MLEKTVYELHDVYEALSILTNESDYIQAALYKNSHFIKKRNTFILYCDCTNYYFEIEKCFKIIETDFKARLVYLQNEDSIREHFLICFISLIIYRLLAEKPREKYIVNEIVKTLREMEVVDIQYNGYIPAYKRT
nr:hypothetical protein [Thomasclavelia cocleata]